MATLFTPLQAGDIFLPNCFDEFLKKPDHLSIPLCNGHGGLSVGKWRHMGSDGFGLRVVGTFNEGLEISLFAGLSITPVNVKGPPVFTPNGGKYCRIVDISEIALVETAGQPLARINGTWPWF